ncbi:hypothetical protein PMZ80_001121 [Knufia obscura]|uniref:Uncharacterized protein n=2 Tax=Knufia TaxID=430999 RepID=A0AAN8ELV9_9EURO|nr:hypothetical protein PMZ80_001121 [Knufia obscura]KAK5958814.1 hypothetical protein OHC33_000657 [Knufia fluminis]
MRFHEALILAAAIATVATASPTPNEGDAEYYMIHKDADGKLTTEKSAAPTWKEDIIMPTAPAKRDGYEAVYDDGHGGSYTSVIGAASTTKSMKPSSYHRGPADKRTVAPAATATAEPVHA